jgi:transcriptional regulator with XRE-family HTH domain
MTTVALASRSGVSVPTVKRILAGKSDSASFANVAAVAEALGIAVSFEARDPDDLRREQARAKSEWLARPMADTAGYQRLVERCYHDFLAGPPRRLWAP